jgi:hypothetical protein
MRLIKLLKYFLALMAAALGFALIILLFAWASKPDITAGKTEYSQEEIERVTEDRKTEIDPNEPLVIYREVDYGLKDADWYPKGQSPILEKLVQESKLPPVEVRCGPEPAVVEGVDGIGTYGGTWYRLTNQTNMPDAIVSRLSYVSLVRWSPWGYPIVPHAAKSYEVSCSCQGGIGPPMVYSLSH